MIDCKKLIHPFKNDPGTSQRNRIDPELLTARTTIDGRKLADLLDYFIKLSRHVQYYDEQLKLSDWQAFFTNSLPFSLASIAKFDVGLSAKNFATQKVRFLKRPTRAGLYLELRTMFVLFKKIDLWYTKIAGQDILLEPQMEKTIKGKLGKSLREFISFANAAKSKFGTKGIDFTTLAAHPVWGLTAADLALEDSSFLTAGNTYVKRLIALYEKTFLLVQTVHDTIKLFGVSAASGLEQALVPLKEEYREKHPPHLAIIFAFLKLFGYLQDDLNGFARKHLDHFYKTVLRLKPKPAEPDHAHLVLAIQRQLERFLVRKGLAFKDGKDLNKTDIIFTADDEIVVNKAMVKEQKTLFLQHAPVRFSGNKALCQTFRVVEGLHIAPDATMADGVDKPFEEASSRETLGAKWSKYRDPEFDFLYPHPAARIGFVMASPVLYLQGGKRKIRLQLSCQVVNNYCGSLQPARSVANPCCDDQRDGVYEGPGLQTRGATGNCDEFFPSRTLFNIVRATLANTYYYVNRQHIAALVALGISKDLRSKLEELLMVRYKRPGQADPKLGEIEDPDLCYCGREEYLFETTLEASDFLSRFNTTEREIMNDLIYPRKAFDVKFSGEKGWVKPSADALEIKMSNINAASGTFSMQITAGILADQDKIGFYNAALLKEDFNTELPLVKVELDDKIKLEIPADGCRDPKDACCEKPFEQKMQTVSLYHFFRDVKVDTKTQIDVEVCELKEFIVQNDESLQNVNAPIYPFGTRPNVIDFDIKKPLPQNANPNLIGPNFYIGSKEIMLKRWNELSVNVDWKDLPVDFKDYYRGYLKNGLDKNKFHINLAILEDGSWKPEKKNLPLTVDVTIKGKLYHDRRLFDSNDARICGKLEGFQTIALKREFFQLTDKYRLNKDKLDKLEATTRNGFMRLNLQTQDFCHKEYSYVLARQMMALGKLPDDEIEDAIYYDTTNGNLVVFNTEQITNDINNSSVIINRAENSVNGPSKLAARAGLSGTITTANADAIRKILAPFIASGENLRGDVFDLKAKINDVKLTIDTSSKFQAVIPNEPWTPIIKSMSLDYTATATVAEIDLIHLYPYAGTFKPEELETGAMLFPGFCDEGNFYIGLESLVPGSTLNLLMQFAEATADSEAGREKPVWYYLENNRWKLMRNGFEVLDDATNGLTTSGIVKFSIPGNISKNNTILNSALHWLRVSVPCSTTSVSELMGIHAQAVKVSFTNEEQNDKLRLDVGLPAGSISKLNEADSSLSTIEQPYTSFGGRRPETEGHFYVRVSELLRHKNRGIQKFDYERLVLEHFPDVYKVKCINHTYGLNANKYINDFTIAPGYVLVAVIPDMTRLKASGSFEPKVPVSILEAIEQDLRKLISPFVRLKVMNPRYEKLNLCIRVKLIPGKDEVFYKTQLNMDVRHFLAPWAIGEYEKLSFGQPVYRSDLIKFLEGQDYIDHIIDLHMVHEDMNQPALSLSSQMQMVEPITARSILVAGSVDICIDKPGCEKWCTCRGEDCCDHKPVPVREQEPFIIG